MTAVETGTARSLNAAGRDLVRATRAATVTEVTADGRRIAAIVPGGPADRTPSRAELDAIMGLLMTRMGPAFKPGAEVGEAELLGRALAEFLGYDPLDILRVAEAALTEANFDNVGAVVAELRDTLTSELGG